MERIVTEFMEEESEYDDFERPYMLLPEECTTNIDALGQWQRTAEELPRMLFFKIDQDAQQDDFRRLKPLRHVLRMRNRQND